MKKLTVLLSACLFSLAMSLSFASSFADEKKIEKPDTPKVHAVSIDSKLIETYSAAQKRTADAQQAVEKTPEWNAFVIRQNQEQTTMLYIMAELGLKPSEGCQPVFDDKTKALVRFDCPTEKPKAKP